MNRLLDIGFQCVGNWLLDNGKFSCRLDSMAGAKNILYAFVIDGVVKYIGKTKMPLARRLYGYQNPGPTQTTNVRNNRNLRDALAESQTVDVLALPDNGLLRYGGFHINLADGLEASLIEMLEPEWNVMGAGGKHGKEPGVGEMESVEAVLDDSGEEEVPDRQATESSFSHVRFSLSLAKTYHRMGFFNIGVDWERYFGGDRQEIEIYVGDGGELIHGYINRSANTNHTPRIMGGVKLRDWFQSGFRVGDQVDVEVRSPVSIRVTRPEA